MPKPILKDIKPRMNLSFMSESDNEDDQYSKSSEGEEGQNEYQLRMQDKEEEKFQYQDYVYEDATTSPLTKSPKNMDLSADMQDQMSNNPINMMDVPNFSFIRPMENNIVLRR